MQNRFGFKDFVFLLLFFVFIFVLFLQMVQRDRQGAVLRQLKDQSETQTALLASMSRTIENLSFSGIAPTTQAGGTGITPGNDPFFADIKAAEKMPGYARGDIVIDNFQGKLGGNLTPYISQDLYSMWVQAKIFDSLLTQDPNTFEYIPELARGYQQSPDGLKFTFQLRHGVRFSDGTPFTVDDVLYTFDFVQNPKINAPRMRSYLTKFKSVKKTADDEVTFEMSDFYYNTISVIASMPIVPKHFYSKFQEEEINQNPGLVMGTGPYRMPDPQSWRPGQKVILQRNELYWGDPGPFDKLIYEEVEEEAAQETMFRNGELDIYRCWAPQFDRLSKDSSVTSRATPWAITSFINGYYFIAWNEKIGGKDSIFTDKRVRKALSLMIDRQRLCKEIYLGHASPISGHFFIGSPQADPTIQPLPYDVEQAKKLMADSGFTARDNSGVLKSAAGTQLQFKFTYRTGDEFTQRVALFVKDNLAKAGVICDLDPQPWAVMIKKLEHRDFEAIYMGWGGGDVEADPYQEFDSSQIQDAGDNFMSYNDPEFDKAIHQARITVDHDARMKLWQQADRILYEDQPYTFMFARQELSFIDSRIQNVKRTKAGLNVVDTWSNPIPWFVPKGAQRYRQ
jgi:peptide/nickel transport system substrate-binding protein